MPPVTITEPDIPTRKADLIIHIHQGVLTTGTGIARSDRYGPLTIPQLRELLTGCHVTVRPVIDLNEVPAVDRYEVPEPIRRVLETRQLYASQPHSNRPATHGTDADHITPYRTDGPPGQTAPDLLTLIGRRWHRWKTHAGLRVRLITPGTLHWHTPHGHEYITTIHGTIDLGRPERHLNTVPHPIPDEPGLHDPDIADIVHTFLDAA